MLHVELLPPLLGVPEGVVVLGLGLLALAYGLRFGWQIISETAFVPALLAVGLLAASILSDRLIPFGETQTLIEDGLKFAGIVFWLTYALTVFEQLWNEQTPQTAA